MRAKFDPDRFDASSRNHYYCTTVDYPDGIPSDEAMMRAIEQLVHSCFEKVYFGHSQFTEFWIANPVFSVSPVPSDVPTGDTDTTRIRSMAFSFQMRPVLPEETFEASDDNALASTITAALADVLPN
jgi:hypothetical protein